ncbi:hypothetical protein [Cellulomonas oligotrophica]|uniref:Uncharacterized protein n=1 Tax=Cellulomonas oligotrophica TaxID=931536 RepID=A0A7Y9FJ25_9CELL|nr:hypothetical protein [Cellulomonas oligotrophica]NYD87802.1 hypothetical protein [Cellulomonas oligotrophica]GIG32993.1 hypothetical protein Col01nite_21520 [Cellulomonas oligotrophica]
MPPIPTPVTPHRTRAECVAAAGAVLAELRRQRAEMPATEVARRAAARPGGLPYAAALDQVRASRGLPQLSAATTSGAA